MFSDSIQFGHVDTLLEFYSAIMRGPELFNNVHFDDFFLMALGGVCFSDSRLFFSEESLSVSSELAKKI